MRKLDQYKPVNGPRGKRFTGDLHDFQQNPLQFMTMLAANYGDVAQFRLGPFQKVFLVSKPELIKEILVSKQTKFIKSLDLKVLKDIVGEGLLTSEKDFHMSQRKLIQPAFKPTHIRSYAKDMISITYDYMNRWEDGKEYLITDDMMNITLGIISKTMFSMNFEEGATIIGNPLETYMKLAIKRMRSLLRLPLWIPTKNNRNYKKSITNLDQVINKIIETRKKCPNSYDDLLGMLMSARNEEMGTRMSDKQLRDELMTIFLAGHETTANALSWTLFLLSQNPKVEQKLYEEIDRVIGQRDIGPEDYSKLLYTQNIISESLRLFPPAYVIGRQVNEDVEIGEYHFKKGEMIVISQYVMHHHPRYFKDPYSFLPERFENDFLKKIPTFSYFPFGGGPRVCIGNHFAMMEAVLVLACIYQRYQIRLADQHHEVKPQPLVTIRPKQGLRMSIHKR